MDAGLREWEARIKASAWEAGFYAGATYGAAVQKHDPQWDTDEPVKPENPYMPVTQQSR